MKNSRSFFLLTIGMGLAFVLAACGSSTGAGPYGVSNNTSSGGQTPASSGGCGRYCSHASTPTPGSTGSAVTIKTATMTVQGKSITALVNNQGMTLYYNTSDTASSVVCSGGCASAWPPVLSTSVPSPVSALPGTLSLLTDANGSQVTYNGHPLYTYSGDSASGQVKGEGVNGVWFVVPTNLAASGSNSNGYPKGGYPGYGY
jgi:predicted lipoprotein with Yx(FWY)xxD motif